MVVLLSMADDKLYTKDYSNNNYAIEQSFVFVPKYLEDKSIPVDYVMQNGKVKITAYDVPLDIEEEVNINGSIYAPYERNIDEALKPITGEIAGGQKISEEQQPKYIEEIIKAKKNQIKLGYGGINEDEDLNCS